MDLLDILRKEGRFTDEQNTQYDNTIKNAQECFEKNLNLSSGEYPCPVAVAKILIGWHIPWQLINTAIWTAAFPIDLNYESLSTIDPNSIHLAKQLNRLNSVLIEQRRFNLDYIDLEKILKGAYWSDELIVMLTAFFLGTLNQATIKKYTNLNYEVLIKQAENIIKPVVSRRLGSWTIRRQILDATCHCKNPKAYNKAQIDLQDLHSKIANLIEEIDIKLTTAIKNNKLSNYEIIHEIADPYRIVNIRNNDSSKPIDPRDLVTYIILAKDKLACYRFIPALTSIGSPGNSFRDYIFHTKSASFPGYRSLHLKITIRGNKPIRFFIRSKEWQSIAEFGVVTNYQKKEESILDTTRTDQLIPPSGNIFIYSVNGEPFILKQDATINDFANQEGLRKLYKNPFTEARVFRNGKQQIINSSTRLENGDILDLSPKIFANQSISNNIIKGQELIINEKKINRKINVITFDQQKVNKQKQSNIDHRLSISISPNYYEFENLKMILCRDCKPYPDSQGNSIIGYLSTTKTITVHRFDCSHINDSARVIPLSWSSGKFFPGSALIEIDAWNRVGLIEAISREIAKCNIDIVELVSKVYTNDTLNIKINIGEVDSDVLRSICNEISKIEYIHSIKFKRSIVDINEVSISSLVNRYTPKPAMEDGIYFGRADERKTIWEIINGKNQTRSVLIKGQQRIGKTSLLKRIEADCQHSHKNFIPIYITIDKFEGDDLQKWFSKQIINKLSIYFPKNEKIISATEVVGLTNDDEILVEFLDRIGRVEFANNRVVILFDEFQRVCQFPNQDQITLFVNFLANIHKAFDNLSFILSTSDLLVTNKNYHILAPLLALTIELPLNELDIKSAQDLIRKPMYPFEYDDDVIVQMMELTLCNPYYIQLLCYDIFEQAKSLKTSSIITKSELTNSIEKLIRNQSRFTHLLDISSDSSEILTSIALMTTNGKKYVSLKELNKRIPSNNQANQLKQKIIDLCELQVLLADKNNTKFRIKLPLFEKMIRKNFNLKV